MRWVKVFEDMASAKRSIPSGTSRLVIIGKHRICLSHTQGAYFAIQDSCPHAGHSLSQGKINYLGEVICPLHSYRFSVKSGREGDGKCKDVLTYRVKVNDQGLYLYL